MKKSHILFLCGMTLVTNAQAKTPQNIESSQSQILMTAQDVSSKKMSNISIINATQSPLTVYGLYIASIDINDCSVCTGNVVSGNNVLGTVVEPIFFRESQAVPIGQNYLYNMIYNGLSVVRLSVIAPPCSLPGCSWPGDDPNVHGWCLSLGAMSLNSNYTFSSYTNPPSPPANVVPLGEAVTNAPFSYNYDLINPASLGAGAACLGLITCDDQTLTCSVASSQSETLQSY